MELTRQQKIEVLKYATDKIRSGQETFMCTAIEKGYCMLEGCEYEDCRYAVKRIPELLSYKPSRIMLTGRDVWFLENRKGKMRRIEISNEILKKLKDDERTEQE